MPTPPTAGNEARLDTVAIENLKVVTNLQALSDAEKMEYIEAIVPVKGTPAKKALLRRLQIPEQSFMQWIDDVGAWELALGRKCTVEIRCRKPEEQARTWALLAIREAQKATAARAVNNGAEETQAAIANAVGSNGAVPPTVDEGLQAAPMTLDTGDQPQNGVRALRRSPAEEEAITDVLNEHGGTLKPEERDRLTNLMRSLMAIFSGPRIPSDISNATRHTIVEFGNFLKERGIDLQPFFWAVHLRRHLYDESEVMLESSSPSMQEVRSEAETPAEEEPDTEESLSEEELDEEELDEDIEHEAKNESDANEEGADVTASREATRPVLDLDATTSILAICDDAEWDGINDSEQREARALVTHLVRTVPPIMPGKRRVLREDVLQQIIRAGTLLGAVNRGALARFQNVVGLKGPRYMQAAARFDGRVVIDVSTLQTDALSTVKTGTENVEMETVNTENIPLHPVAEVIYSACERLQWQGLTSAEKTECEALIAHVLRALPPLAPHTKRLLNDPLPQQIVRVCTLLSQVRPTLPSKLLNAISIGTERYAALAAQYNGNRRCEFTPLVSTRAEAKAAKITAATRGSSGNEDTTALTAEEHLAVREFPKNVADYCVHLSRNDRVRAAVLHSRVRSVVAERAKVGQRPFSEQEKALALDLYDLMINTGIGCETYFKRQLGLGYQNILNWKKKRTSMQESPNDPQPNANVAQEPRVEEEAADSRKNGAEIVDHPVTRGDELIQRVIEGLNENLASPAPGTVEIRDIRSSREETNGEVMHDATTNGFSAHVDPQQYNAPAVDEPVTETTDIVWQSQANVPGLEVATLPHSSDVAVLPPELEDPSKAFIAPAEPQTTPREPDSVVEKLSVLQAFTEQVVSQLPDVPENILDPKRVGKVLVRFVNDNRGDIATLLHRLVDAMLETKEG